MGGRAGGVGAARPPSHVPYYVATGGIVVLLLLLCFYFFYFFAKRVKELSSQESPLQSPAPAQSRSPPPPSPAPVPAPGPITLSYPVQPEVRESAAAMAKLCKQFPPPSCGKGGSVFPASSSPPALHTDTSAPGRHEKAPLAPTSTTTGGGVTEVPPAR